MEVKLGKNKENYKYEVYLQDLTLIDLILFTNCYQVP